MFVRNMGWDGFFGSRGSFMLDFVVLAMMILVPLMAISISVVRFRRQYVLHKWIQTILGITLLVTVIGFEIEMRTFDWTERARPSPFWMDGPWNDLVDFSLGIHLCFAIPTPFLWTYVLLAAWLRFPSPPEPSGHSLRHRYWARLAALMMVCTAITGWIFYGVAFVAA